MYLVDCDNIREVSKSCTKCGAELIGRKIIARNATCFKCKLKKRKELSEKYKQQTVKVVRVRKNSVPVEKKNVCICCKVLLKPPRTRYCSSECTKRDYMSSPTSIAKGVEKARSGDNIVV